MRRSCDRPIAAALAAIVSVGLALCGCANGGGETTIPTTGASAVCTSPTAPGSVARPGGGSRVAWVRVIPVSTLPPAVIIGQVGVVVEADH